MRIVTRGLLEIALATIAGDGGPGTSFTGVGYTSRDSETTIQTADPTITEFFANESDTAIDTTTQAGSTTIAFSLMAVDEDDLITWQGGSKTGTGSGADPYVYSAGDTIPDIYRTVKVTPRSGRIAVFNRVKLSAKINWNLGPDGLFLLDVNGTVLQPLKTGVKRFTMALPATA